jgi:hypothetical protein
MITQRLIPLAIIYSLLLVAGCAGPEEVAKTDGPAQAPDPRAKVDKTKAELLVGKWKFVKRTPPADPFYPTTYEYTPDGKVTKWRYPSEQRPWANEQLSISAGTYRIEGETLFTTIGELTEAKKTIETITEDKLVIVWYSGSTRMVSEYERIRGDF